MLQALRSPAMPMSSELLQIEPGPGAGRRAQRRPAWIRVRAPGSAEYERTRGLMRELDLHTVCEEAACPNVGECWSKRHATAMVLGSVCTRKCGFCNVRTGRPERVDPGEPARLAEAVRRLGLRHVVVTSVDRDDLPDGGAGHFASCIEAIRRAAPGTTIEVLTPDFLRKPGALERVARARPDVYNHNLETVPRLYPRARRGADYRHSLELLRRAKRIEPGIFTKSGIMLGLGETRAEVEATLDDMRAADVDFVTVGQYLSPSRRHLPVERYARPEEFDAYARSARRKGFLLAACAPLVRSSYHADEDFRKLSEARRERALRGAAR